MWLLKACVAALIACVVILACTSGANDEPVSGCGTTLSFTVLPVPITAIAAATPVGNMGPPGHTIPTDHSGLYLSGPGITLTSPGPLRVTQVARVHYLVSPFRQGAMDYTVTANACNGYSVVFGHIQTVVDRIASQAGGQCSTYSTANETVESCRNDSANISLSAGDTIGTVGGPSAGAFDFGLYNTSIRNVFVNPGRYSDRTLTATCAYEPFSADLRALLFAKIGEPGIPASGEPPLCGTMNVDLAGTVRGVWVLQSAPVNQEGDESNFLALAPHPLSPQTGQTLSVGPASLNPIVGFPLLKYPRLTAGRVNRQFSDVTADGLIYCYVSDASTARFSYFVRLATGNVLTLQLLNHGAGATPCSGDPAGWVFGSGATTFIR